MRQVTYSGENQKRIEQFLLLVYTIYSFGIFSCCSVKQLELIKRELLRCIPFERVIVQKASFTTACNVGMKSVGVSVYLNKK